VEQPAGHVVHSLDPAAEYLPPGQAVHDCVGVLPTAQVCIFVCLCVMHTVDALDIHKNEAHC
jgi:hypothetical protein